MLKRLKQQGITILVSTPYMDEASLCERIALLQNGKIMSIDTPKKIVEQFPEKLYAIKASNMSKLLTDLRKSQHITSCNSFGEYHHITFAHELPLEAEKLLMDELKAAGHTDVELKLITPTIEDCFIKLMN
jgi:ABC-type multidrug transport system ATPase subunit